MRLLIRPMITAPAAPGRTYIADYHPSLPKGSQDPSYQSPPTVRSSGVMYLVANSMPSQAGIRPGSKLPSNRMAADRSAARRASCTALATRSATIYAIGDNGIDLPTN